MRDEKYLDYAKEFMYNIDEGDEQDDDGFDYQSIMDNHIKKFQIKKEIELLGVKLSWDLNIRRMATSTQQQGISKIQSKMPVMDDKNMPVWIKSLVLKQYVICHMIKVNIVFAQAYLYDNTKRAQQTLYAMGQKALGVSGNADKDIMMMELSIQPLSAIFKGDFMREHLPSGEIPTLMDI